MVFTHQGDLAYLPQEIFQMVVCHLEHVDFVRCRRVSSSWYRAFTNPASLVQILKSSYSLAKEVRGLLQAGAPNSCQIMQDNNLQDCIRAIFDRITERYYRLARGIPRSIQKFDLQKIMTAEGEYRFFSVPPWETHSTHSGHKIDMLFDHAFWTYEEGLVVFPDEIQQSLTLLDLETQHVFMVPFITTNKVIRRIRLQDKLLVIEWAEEESFHWLNERDSVHRHYATSFEINRVGKGWDIALRNEWKIMFLGHPLGDRDRFFSTHNRRHYAIYAWQPNRSLYTAEEDAPIESLFIWDISEKSDYRASQDPTGRLRDTSTNDRPFVVAIFTFRELAFHSVRQGGFPKIMRMDIDSDSNSISLTEVMDAGRVDYNTLEYAPKTRVTTIPFIGYGPSWSREVRTMYPPYRGNCSMEIPSWMATSPWPCYWGICECLDEEARVSFCISYLSSRIQTGYETDPLMLTVHTPQSIKTLSHDLAKEVSFKAKISGDERFLIGENAHNQLVILYF